MPGRESGPVVIGFYGDLSSTGASAGNDALKGAELRIKDANASGGVSGRKVSLVIRDVKQSPTGAVEAFTSMAQDGKVCAVIGAAILNAGLAVSPVADLSRVPLVSLSLDDRVTTPEWKPENPDTIGLLRRFSFLVQPSGAVLAAAVARYAIDRFLVKRLAVLYDSASTLSVFQARAFERAVKQAGRLLVASRELQPGNEAVPLGAVREAGAEAMFICGSAEESVEVARAVKTLGLQIVLLGSQSLYDPIVSAASDVAVNAWFPLPLSPDDPGLAKLAPAYTAEYGESPRVAVAAGWDAAGLILSAVQKAGSSRPQLVRDALEQTSGYRAVGGTFDMNRKTHRPADVSVAIMRVANGAFQTEQRRYVVP